MLNSTVLEVAIGLSFAYAALALISSSIYEAGSSVLKLRARSLWSGIQTMLDDKNTELARALYAHPMVNPRGWQPTATKDAEARGPQAKPSYIDSVYFAIALVDALQTEAGKFQDLRAKIQVLPDTQVRSVLLNFYDRAHGNAAAFQASIEHWFDMSMARVSGGYKRNAQLFTFMIAFALAAAFNLDSFHLFAVLWKHPGLVASLGTPSQDAARTLGSLAELPVGWHAAPSWTAVLGWIVSASSALFGAPFWFDLLSRLTNLRGTGPKPKPKAEEARTVVVSNTPLVTANPAPSRIASVPA